MDDLWEQLRAKGWDEKLVRFDLGPCWEWRANVGRAIFKGVTLARLVVGLPGKRVDERIACHHCDNPRCIRPEHIYVGTHSDNNRDAHVRGRNVYGAKASMQNYLNAGDERS